MNKLTNKHADWYETTHSRCFGGQDNAQDSTVKLQYYVTCNVLRILSHLNSLDYILIIS